MSISRVLQVPYTSNEFLNGKNIFVQGLTKIQSSIEDTSESSKYIIGYNGEMEEYTSKIFTTQYELVNSGVNTISYQSVDANGNISDKIYYNITCKDYQTPKIKSVIIYRGLYNNNEWQDDSNGTDIRIILDYSFSTFNIAGDNSATIKVVLNQQTLAQETLTSNSVYIKNAGTLQGLLEISISDAVNPTLWSSVVEPIPIPESGGGIDSIVAEGTSGIWYYRKWSSGIGECWGRVQQTCEIARTWGDIYVSGTSAGPIPSPAHDYPFPFKTLKSVNASPWAFDGSSYGMITAALGTLTKTPQYQVTRGTKGSRIDWSISFDVKGTWK